MKQGERFTFSVIPSSICGPMRGPTLLSIPVGDDAWWNKKFMTRLASPSLNTWYFMALNPSWKVWLAEGEPYGPPFIWQKMYADIDLERGEGVVGEPVRVHQKQGAGGSFNTSMQRMMWGNSYDIFLISNESSLMNWNKEPWGDLK